MLGWVSCVHSWHDGSVLGSERERERAAAMGGSPYVELL